jgi:hypothetical protein
MRLFRSPVRPCVLTVRPSLTPALRLLPGPWGVEAVGCSRTSVECRLYPPPLGPQFCSEGAKLGSERGYGQPVHETPSKNLLSPTPRCPARARRAGVGVGVSWRAPNLAVLPRVAWYCRLFVKKDILSVPDSYTSKAVSFVSQKHAFTLGPSEDLRNKSHLRCGCAYVGGDHREMNHISLRLGFP